jgi:hypothetical protein
MVGSVTATARSQSVLSCAPPIRQRSNQDTIVRWLVFLLLAGSLLRLCLWFVYGPVAYPDTGTYMRPAQNILARDFSTYDGRRPPGYPLVLAIAALSPDATWALQMLMGLAISVFLFYVAFVLTRSPALAALAGMTYNLNLSQLFYEANLVSETTTTFATTGVAALLLLSYRRIHDKRRVWPWLLGLGLLTAFATLTRPQFVFLPVLTATLIGYASWGRAGTSIWRSAGRIGLTFLTSTVLVLGCCWFNYAKVGFFTLSTQTGMALMEHTLAFIELAPDRYATIRDIYVRHRDAKLAQTGRHTAVWDGLPEAMAATGLSLPALSNELARMSIEMFVRHPVRYATGVAHAWADFWAAPMHWQPAMLRVRPVRRFVRLVWRLEQPILRLANAVFLALVAVATLSPVLRHRLRWDLGFTTLAAIVLGASLVQALTIWVDNARYAITVQPLVVMIVLSAVYRLTASSEAIVATHSMVEKGT